MDEPPRQRRLMRVGIGKLGKRSFPQFQLEHGGSLQLWRDRHVKMAVDRSTAMPSGMCRSGGAFAPAIRRCGFLAQLCDRLGETERFLVARPQSTNVDRLLLGFALAAH